MDSLRAQTEPPDELLVALDHPEDDTLDTILDQLEHNKPPFPVKLLDILAPRAGDNPASGIPDNCLFHAALGEVIIHTDDDCALPPDFCRTMRLLFRGLPPSIIWGQLTFVDDQRQPLPSHAGHDCRAWLAVKHHWPTLPGSVIALPPHMQLHWGAIFTATARDIRRIGGHNIEHCGYHNTDTRLGNRLVHSAVNSYVTSGPELTTLHLGKTWYAQHVEDKPAILRSQGPNKGQRIANGGQAFWTSPWFDSAYRELDTK
jgi:hypothetical protein